MKDVEVFVARQAIFDRRRQVYGYELLFRSTSTTNEFDGTEGSLATAQVLANSLLAIGLENLVGRSQAFVNFGRELLLEDWYGALPQGSAVIEVLETEYPDADIVEACRRIRGQGYRVALDDFVLRPEYQQLLEIADVVKVEINRCAREEQSRLIASCHRRGTKMLAEKLETYEEFEWARRAGYDYFQGYFFARPVVVRARQIPAVKLNCLRLLAEAQRPELDFYRLERMIEADVSFSYKLLRYVNSALFACKTEIRSITQALALAGETDLRHWIALAALPRVAVDKPEELTVQSLVRARFGESIARLLGLDLAHEAFLMGLFSMLDALIDLPMDEALSQVSLAQEITTVLTGLALDDDPLCRIYKLLRAYEAADWDRVLNLAGELGLRAQCLSEAYCKALRWVHESLSMTG